MSFSAVAIAVVVMTIILAAATCTTAFEFTQPSPFSQFSRAGFRGVPFFRLGLECPAATSSSTKDKSAEPCAVVHADLRFTGLRRGFAQLIVYRADKVEWDVLQTMTEQRKLQQHICSSHGQLFGAAVLRSFSSDAFAIDASSSPSSSYSDVSLQGAIPLSEPGFYIFYPNACTFRESVAESETDLQASATFGGELLLEEEWGQQQSSTTTTTTTANGTAAGKGGGGGGGMSGTLSVRSAVNQYLPAQVAPLVPGFAVLASIDFVMLVAFTSSIVVSGGGARLVNKYQIAITIVLACNLLSATLLAEFLRELRDGNRVREPLQIVAVVFGAAKEALSRTVVVFLLLGVGLTRVRFAPHVSRAIAILAVIYFVFRVAVDRVRIWRELSLYPVFASDHSSVTFDSPWLTVLHIHPFAIYVDRAVCISLDICLALFLVKCTRKTLAEIPYHHQPSVSESTVEGRKRRTLVRSAAVLAAYSLLSAAWLIAQLALFSSSSWSSSSSDAEVRNSKLQVETRWKLWSMMELVPGVLDRLVTLAMVVIWFPSPDSQFWNSPASLFSSSSSSSAMMMSSNNEAVITATNEADAVAGNTAATTSITTTMTAGTARSQLDEDDDDDHHHHIDVLQP